MHKIGSVHSANQRSLPAIMRQFCYQTGAIYVQHGTDISAVRSVNSRGGVRKYIIPQLLPITQLLVMALSLLHDSALLCAQDTRE